MVGFIAIGLRLHALTWTIKVANAERRPVPELVAEAWRLHGRWTVAFLSTLVAVAAIVLALTLLSVLRAGGEMKSDEIRAICIERLGRWTESCVRAHVTPMVLISVGHDHAAGRIVIATIEEMSDDALRLLLLGAAKLHARA